MHIQVPVCDQVLSQQAAILLQMLVHHPVPTCASVVLQMLLDNVVELLLAYGSPQLSNVLPFLPRPDPQPTPGVRLTLRHTYEMSQPNTVTIVFESTAARAIGPDLLQVRPDAGGAQVCLAARSGEWLGEMVDKGRGRMRATAGPGESQMGNAHGEEGDKWGRREGNKGEGTGTHGRVREENQP